MRKFRTLAIKTILLGITFVGGCWGAWKSIQYFHYKRYIPNYINVTYPIYIEDEVGGITEGCGVAIYHLSSRSANAIDEQGIHFFTSDWKEAPINLEAGETSGLDGFLCVSLPDDLDIHSSLARRGVYYTYSRENILIVIPEQNLVIFSYFG